MVPRRKDSFRFGRLSVLTIVVFILAALLVFKLFTIQVLRGQTYAARASGQQKVYQEFYPKRGSIYVYREDYSLNNHLYPIAANESRFEVYVVPKNINDAKKFSQTLASSSILNLAIEALEAKVSKQDDPYESLAKDITEKQVAALQELKLETFARDQKEKVLDFLPQDIRIYPEANYYSHLAGFLGYLGNKRAGQYGLEGALEKTLSGRTGKLILESDILSGWLPNLRVDAFKASIAGSDIVLTIDNNIQHLACDALREGVIKFEADGGSIIFINAKTGAVLAMCGYPDFDPNNYSQVKNINIFINPAVNNTFEPGSIFKVITMSAGLDSGAVKPETTYEDTGAVKIDKHTIKNSDLLAHGKQTMVEVLEKSLNTGAIFVMRQMGAKTFKQYIENFGFGVPTGIELTPEPSGNISNLKKNGEIYNANISFGQGLTVTPIQMLTAFTAITNNGYLLKPYIIAKIIRPNGQVKETKPENGNQVLKLTTVTKIKAILTSVVRNGYSKKADVPGYYVAGKTGTAQMSKKGARGYSEQTTIHSFIGFAPVDNPLFIGIVKLDQPKAVGFAADSAAPIFGRIAKFILDYYQIPPDEE